MRAKHSVRWRFDGSDFLRKCLFVYVDLGVCICGWRFAFFKLEREKKAFPEINQIKSYSIFDSIVAQNLINILSFKQYKYNFFHDLI